MDIAELLALPDLTVDEVNATSSKYDIYCHVNHDSICCPSCQKLSTKVSSHYMRTIQDLPIAGHTTWLHVDRRKFFCKNPQCKRQVFVEPLSFVHGSSRRTDRLNKRVLNDIIPRSSILSGKLLRKDGIQIHHTSICNLVNKVNRTSRS